MRQKAVKTFHNGIETDIDLHQIPQGKLIYALNIRRGRGSIMNAVTNVKGNTLIEFELPDGDNECIGSVEDKTYGTIIYFLYNSLGNHAIYRYWPLEARIEQLLQSNELSFEIKWKIHSAKVLEGRLLYWANSSNFGQGIEGLPPRKINIDKASNYGKTLTYELVLGNSVYATGVQFFYSVSALDGTVITPSTLLYTVPAGPPARNVIVNQLRSALTGVNINSQYILINTDGTDQLILSSQTAGQRIDITCTIGNIFFSPLNHYPVTVKEEYLTLIKPIPKCAPKPRYVVDPDYTEVRVFNYAFQFRYRYVFDDGERSAWSSASYVPTNFVPWSGSSSNAEVENSQLYNLIKIVFDDPLLSDNDWRCYIRAIELAVRYDEIDPWRFVNKYNLYELGVDEFAVYFYNESTYSAVPSDENSAPDQQALKNFDFVPLLSSTTEVIADENGNTVMVWGGNQENYDLTEIRADLSVVGEAIDASPYPLEQVSQFKGFKTGGVYRVCVIYEDFFGRQAIVPIGRTRIPFTQIGAATQHIEIDFNTPPPPWAIRYRIGVTKNQNQSDYVQLPAWSVTYWKYNPSDDEMTSTNYGAGDADYVGFDFNIADLNDNTTLRNYIFDQFKNTQRIFLPEPRDRIQVLNWDIHTGPSTIDIQDYNYAIEGYSLTYPNDSVSDPAYRFTVFIKFDPSQPDYNDFGSSEGANDWLLMEIYRPGTVISDDIFYEIGDCYDIIDDPDPIKRSHGGTVSLYRYGDTYNLAKEYSHKFNGSTVTTVTVPHIQRQTLYSFINEPLADLGRVVAFDPNYEQVYSSDQIRATGVFVPGSGINNLNAFRGTDYIKLNKQYGPLNKLGLIDRVLLAVCAFKSQPIYVGKDRTVDLSGQTLIGRSSSLLNIADELAPDLGTWNPESIVVDEGKIIGFDIYKGVVWRYTSGGGQQRISDEGIAKEILDFSLENYSNDLSNFFAYGGINRQFGEYYLTFPEKTHVYDYEGSLWMGERSFGLEMHGWVGLQHITFFQGFVWLSESNENYCNFYGSQFSWYATIVVNDMPLDTKLFWNIRIQGTQRPVIPVITIPETIGYLGGMTSQIPANRFKVYEGQFDSDFLRDQTDPTTEFAAIVNPTERLTAALLRGRPLRGEVVLIKIGADDPSKIAILRTATISYTKSQQ